MSGCMALQRPAGATPCGRPTQTAAAIAAARRSLALQCTWPRAVAAAAQAARQQQPDGGSSPAAGGKAADGTGSPSKPRRRGPLPIISRDSEEDITAARQRLQAYLQQQGGISEAKAAKLAGKLSAVLGAAAADQLVPAPLQWFIGRGMQPVEAAQLLVHMCKSGRNATHAYLIRQWPTWQPVFEANWQLSDSYLAAYQQQCKAAKQRPLKSSQSMAVLLSGMPSRYFLLIGTTTNVACKLALVQQQLRLTDAELGELIAAGLSLGGSAATLAAAMQWLVSFAGSREAAASMLRVAPSLLSYPAATLDSKVAALHEAWAGKLQPGQVQRRAQKFPVLFATSEHTYGPTADVLRSWFPQPSELLAVLATAPALLVASAASLRANERWFTGPPLSLSRQQFLVLVRAAPQLFARNLAAPLTQHKLAFLTEVAGVPLERALSCWRAPGACFE